MRQFAAMRQLTVILSLVAPATLLADTDPTTGLKIDRGWEQTRAHCGACHSYKLVTQNRGDRETWLGLIRWMQKTRNLWPIPETAENEILDYLSKNYAADLNQRRRALPEHLMPE